MRLRSLASAVLPVLLLAAALSAPAQQAAPPPSSIYANHPLLKGTHFKPARKPVKARLWTDADKMIDVVLLGTTEDSVAYALRDSPGKLEDVIPLAKVRRAVFDFSEPLDSEAFVEARRTRDDAALCKVLLKTYAESFPFLALPGNNAVENVSLLASTMMTIAGRTRRTARTDEENARAIQQYERACEVLVALAEAKNWSPEGAIAVVKYCQCLLARGKVKTATFHLDELDEPMPGDAAYGHYWLVRGLLAEERGEWEEAVRDAVLSVDFESKNGESFPAALLLSARAYEELEEWYRARDIYYEVAMLFQNTDFGDDALDRLRFIMDNGKTDAPEADQTVENAFFGLAEDMNKLSRELLKRKETK